MEKQAIKRYSQAFEQQVVREYEGGASIYHLMQKYGIGAHETVKRWVERYSRAGYRNEVQDQLLANDASAAKAPVEFIRDEAVRQERS